MSQKVLGLDDRLAVIEQLLRLSPNSKLERIDQLEKELNALKQGKHAQEEAKVPVPEPQDFQQFIDELKEKLKFDEL